MKILELRFKNLNSLQGEWKIDFTTPEYTENGIFALTGPTGAGKSTILDAICLALYGKTPRLDTISKTQNEIMSRQTGECYAAIIFSTKEGDFCCEFTQARAKGKAEGNLQNPKHSIFSYPSMDVLDDSRSGVLRLVEEKCGMDFDRFTRSILLAQGKFDSFLKAKANEKSAILEQITGTEIYTEISKMVHERLREEKENLKSLSDKMSVVNLLDEPMHKELNEKAKTLQEEHQKEHEKKKSVDAQIVWHENIEKIIKDLQEITKQEELLSPEILAFTAEKELLEKSLLAKKAEAWYKELALLCLAQEKDNKSLEKEEKLLPKLETEWQKSKETLQKQQEAWDSLKKDEQNQKILFNQVRLLDQKIGLERKAFEEETKIYTHETQKSKSLQEDLHKTKTLTEEYQKKSQETQIWLKEHEKDALLVGELSRICEQLKSLELNLKQGLELRQELVNEQKNVEQTEKKIQVSKKEQEQSQKELGIVGEQLKKLEIELKNLLNGKLLREYHTEKDSLLREKVLVEKIQALESHRERLEDNQPCPLCGSLEHPYAQGNIPKLSELDIKIQKVQKIILEVEKVENFIKKYQEEEKQSVLKQGQTQNALQLLQKDREQSLARLEEKKKVRQNCLELYQEKEKDLLTVLKPLGITQSDTRNPDILQKDLEKKLFIFQQQSKTQEELNNKILLLHKELEQKQITGKELEQKLIGMQEKQSKERFNIQTDELERQKLFADKNVDKEEHTLQQNLMLCEKKVREQETICQAQELLLTQNKATSATLKAQTKDRQTQINNKQIEFGTKLNELGFTCESDYLNACLQEDKIKTLQDKQDFLQEKEQKLKHHKQEKNKELEAEQQKNISQESLEQLKILRLSTEENLKTQLQEINKIHFTLEKNKEEVQKSKSLQTQYKEAQKKLERIDKLHVLIGSADGKKFRNFAQGLTFEVMIAHANKQLSKMNDRYLLLHSETQALEIDVIDNYQAGEIRPTLNLSGGESFLISLALALGLSQMASQKVQVDSLFLDEGFGTLDEETLETALSTLATIQEEGKIIGIISHVQALKERIHTQIQVKPISGGKSILQGAGCMEL